MLFITTKQDLIEYLKNKYSVNTEKDGPVIFVSELADLIDSYERMKFLTEIEIIKEQTQKTNPFYDLVD